MLILLFFNNMIRNNIVWQGDEVISNIQILAHITKNILNSLLDHDWIAIMRSFYGFDPWSRGRFKYPRVERYSLTTWAHLKI